MIIKRKHSITHPQQLELVRAQAALWKGKYQEREHAIIDERQRAAYANHYAERVHAELVRTKRELNIVSCASVLAFVGLLVAIW